ncbi:hypothetical protein BV25DRAFT_1843577 [Artomyces pyxidatus]|uniref:Uncharacterized protein n=1 Tax=Artomyces pyxidatus TaxID=48021 RepID=A0ACB8SE48_9AGAM|nr:hypothetical protein BV25DRAFT_1843577 [Artomyces pyxidatus]
MLRSAVSHQTRTATRLREGLTNDSDRLSNSHFPMRGFSTARLPALPLVSSSGAPASQRGSLPHDSRACKRSDPGAKRQRAISSRAVEHRFLAARDTISPTDISRTTTPRSAMGRSLKLIAAELSVAASRAFWARGALCRAARLPWVMFWVALDIKTKFLHNPCILLVTGSAVISSHNDGRETLTQSKGRVASEKTIWTPTRGCRRPTPSSPGRAAWAPSHRPHSPGVQVVVPCAARHGTALTADAHQGLAGWAPSLGRRAVVSSAYAGRRRARKEEGDHARARLEADAAAARRTQNPRLPLARPREGRSL